MFKTINLTPIAEYKLEVKWAYIKGLSTGLTISSIIVSLIVIIYHFI